METNQRNEAPHEVVEDRISPQPRFWREEEADELVAGGGEAVTPDGAGEIVHEEWAVGSACYMCHSCTNFGVHGKEGRPCAKGLSDLINRRHKLRRGAKAA